MLPEHKQILVVDDEPNLRRVLSAQLERDGYDVHTAEDGEQALTILKEHHIDLVITDLRMPRIDGMELLRRTQKMDPELPVVMITAHGTVDNAVEALKTGAFDYLTKPFDQVEVRTIVAKALKTRALSATEASHPFHEIPVEGARYGIIGQSNSILDLYAVLDRVADTPTTVLITGESGTGKELVARALHESSSRRDKSFIKVNCAAIPRDLMESELFGYERGAFTGAVGSKPGRFELASGGTLFLDEIGSIPIEMQVKLLRALQESEFERVGGVRTIRVDVRLIAATNSDLKKEIAQGAFREDLYYRLQVISIRLPTLAERDGDAVLLAQYFSERAVRAHKLPAITLSPAALRAIDSCEWGGNMRELANAVEVATIRAAAQGLQRIEEWQLFPDASPTRDSPAALTFQQEPRRFQAALVSKILGATDWNVSEAARRLDLTRAHLYNLIKSFDLKR